MAIKIESGIDFDKATFKDFEDIPGVDMFERASLFCDFLKYSKENGWVDYRMMNYSGCTPEMKVNTPLNSAARVNLVSNDYLGFTHHPKVIEAAIEGIRKYGTGAGASPLIGGFFSYHKELERIRTTYANNQVGIFTLMLLDFDQQTIQKTPFSIIYKANFPN